MIWVCSDHHFGHANLLTFRETNGRKTRPGFDSIDHMNQALVESHNRVVGKDDQVLFLGDIGQDEKLLGDCLKKMNGKKFLVPGNHDSLPSYFYAEHFYEIKGWFHFKSAGIKLLCTHFPLHPRTLWGRDTEVAFNVHGHTHARKVKDWRYINVCLEETDYEPVTLESLFARAAKAIPADHVPEPLGDLL